MMTRNSLKSSRVAPKKEDETRLLIETRRRCCLCVFLHRDWEEKQVQVAHIDHDRSNSQYSNLAILCLYCHDKYDTKPKQSKGYTAGELKKYQQMLIDKISKFQDTPPFMKVNFLETQLVESVVNNNPETESIIDNFWKDIEIILRFKRITASDNIKELIKTLTIRSEYSLKVKDVEIIDDSYIFFFSDEHDWNWELLILLKEGEEWHPYNELHFEHQKGEKPTIQIIKGNPYSLFFIQHIANTGTGIYSKSVLVCRASEGVTFSLLTLDIDSYQVGWGTPVDWFIKGKIPNKKKFLKNGSILTYKYSIKFIIGNSCEDFWIFNNQASGARSRSNRSHNLFTFSKDFQLVWDAQSGILVPQNINYTTDEIFTLLHFDLYDFVIYFIDEIYDLAINGSALQKSWAKYIILHELRSNKVKRMKSFIEKYFTLLKRI